jgi:hypothetical protein
MRRLFFAATLGLLVTVSAVLALDAPATVKKVNSDRGTILVFARHSTPFRCPVPFA